MLKLRITWDDKVADDHWRKHKISFEDAQEVFYDPYSITEPDARYHYSEDRYWTLGMAKDNHLLLYVAHTYEEEGTILVIEIISARKAESHERRLYGNRKF